MPKIIKKVFWSNGTEYFYQVLLGILNTIFTILADNRLVTFTQYNPYITCVMSDRAWEDIIKWIHRHQSVIVQHYFSGMETCALTQLSFTLITCHILCCISYITLNYLPCKTGTKNPAPHLFPSLNPCLMHVGYFGSFDREHMHL